MTIKGINAATVLAVRRVQRSKEAICIVKVAEDEYVLWREKTIHGVILAYPNANVIRTIRIKHDTG